MGDAARFIRDRSTLGRSESADQLLRYLSVNFVTDITYILSKSPMLVN